MPAFFRPNPRFKQEMANDPGVHDQLRKRATRAISIAQATTHRKFATGFYVEDTETGVRGGTTNPFFHLDEWGSIHNPPRAPLRRAVRATGARLEETGR